MELSAPSAPLAGSAIPFFEDRKHQVLPIAPLHKLAEGYSPDLGLHEFFQNTLDRFVEMVRIRSPENPRVPIIPRQRGDPMGRQVWEFVHKGDVLASLTVTNPADCDTCRQATAADPRIRRHRCITIELVNAGTLVSPFAWRPFESSKKGGDLSQGKYGVGMKKAAAVLLKSRTSVETMDGNTILRLFRSQDELSHGYLAAGFAPSGGTPADAYKVTITHLQPDAFNKDDFLFFDPVYCNSDPRNTHLLLVSAKHAGVQYNKGFRLKNPLASITHFGVNACIDAAPDRKREEDPKKLASVIGHLLVEVASTSPETLEWIWNLSQSETTENSWEVQHILDTLAEHTDPGNQILIEKLADRFCQGQDADAIYPGTKEDVFFIKYLTHRTPVIVTLKMSRVLLKSRRFPPILSMQEKLSTPYKKLPLPDQTESLAKELRDIQACIDQLCLEDPTLVKPRCVFRVRPDFKGLPPSYGYAISTQDDTECGIFLRCPRLSPAQIESLGYETVGEALSVYLTTAMLWRRIISPQPRKFSLISLYRRIQKSNLTVNGEPLVPPPRSTTRGTPVPPRALAMGNLAKSIDALQTHGGAKRKRDPAVEDVKPEPRFEFSVPHDRSSAAAIPQAPRAELDGATNTYRHVYAAATLAEAQTIAQALKYDPETWAAQLGARFVLKTDT